jgi:hypothetical protein
MPTRQEIREYLADAVARAQARGGNINHHLLDESDRLMGFASGLSADEQATFGRVYEEEAQALKEHAQRDAERAVARKVEGAARDYRVWAFVGTIVFVIWLLILNST